MKAKVIAVSFGQRSDFPRANALWFSNGQTFVSENALGEMWEFRIGKTTKRVESGIKKNNYTQKDFIRVFTGHLSGRLVFSHRIYDQDEADSVIKNYNLVEIK